MGSSKIFHKFDRFYNKVNIIKIIIIHEIKNIEFNLIFLKKYYLKFKRFPTQDWALSVVVDFAVLVCEFKL